MGCLSSCLKTHRCRHHAQAFVSKLATFSTTDLESIQQDGGTDLHCNFCAETYNVSADDIGELITIKELQR